MLLDTNVSCPEGINEVLAEDDVSWQITKVRTRLLDEYKNSGKNRGRTFFTLLKVSREGYGYLNRFVYF